MRRYAMVLAILVMALAACGDEQPPTQIYVVFSPTPEASTPEATDDTTTTIPVVTPTVAPTSTPLELESTPGTTATQTQLPVSATSLPDIFPTSTVAEVQIAEQVFERGRMFWVRHNRQIWVMQAGADDPNSGDWFCYNDTFQEGEMEIDPNLIPPEGLYQPRRGFGKLWRNHPEIKDGLGWAITPEFELTSRYTYIPGGYVQNNQYFPGPGEHRLTTLYNESISFFEGEIRGDCQGGTWRLAPTQ